MPAPRGVETELSPAVSVDHVPSGDESELFTHHYTVVDEAWSAQVGITPYARQKGNEQYSQVTVSRVRVEGGRNLASKIETDVTPPLDTEEARHTAAVKASRLAIELAMLDFSDTNS